MPRVFENRQINLVVEGMQLDAPPVAATRLDMRGGPGWPDHRHQVAREAARAGAVGINANGFSTHDDEASRAADRCENRIGDPVYDLAARLHPIARADHDRVPEEYRSA